jgi:hypothetical protein
MDSIGSSISTLQAASAVSDNTSSVSFIGSFISSESTSTIADIAEGKAWAAIEVIRSVCLQGNQPTCSPHLRHSQTM